MTSKKYRNEKGQFVKVGETVEFKDADDKLYQDFLEVEKRLPTVDLSDPETRQVIKDISRPVEPKDFYQPIHNTYYIVWIVGSLLGMIAAYYIGTLVYRP
jgi:hypothetical protein